jgi:hypothetical protein
VIVVSAALVLGALVLLIVGMAVHGLSLVYSSIAISLASALLLFLGWWRRREQGTAVLAGTGLSGAAFTGRPTAPAAPPVAPPVAPPPAAVPADLVTVVSGRPRYHRSSCRWVRENPGVEQLERWEAAELGFTPCGVCRPDAPTVAPAGTVTVIEGRARFHRASCRYASAAARAETVDRETALQRGLRPCGTCRP